MSLGSGGNGLDSSVIAALGRAALLYLILLASVRIMGKREIGALSPSDLVVAILIAELASVPIDNLNMPLWHGIAPILAIVAMQILFSYGSMRYLRLRQFLEGTPAVVIKNGEIIQSAMRQNRYNLDDLMQQLREKGWPDPADIEFAVLETNGSLSIIPKSQCRPVTPGDLGIATAYEGLPHILIRDGKVDDQALRECGLNRQWLDTELRKRQVGSSDEVFLAVLNSKGELYVQKKEL